MATKPIDALVDVLEDLTSDNFKRFCFELIIHNEVPRVKRIKVEGKSHLDVADAMVSTFTDEGALRVATEILNQINCNAEAERLGEISK